jgi:hypothetical protein
LVSVKIGSEQIPYRIHKALLEHHSDYFRNALRQCWKEGNERQVVLGDLEPAAFDVFVDWMYTKTIPEQDAEWLEREADEEYYRYNCRVNLLRLKVYAVADRLGVQELLETINNNFVDENIVVPPCYEEIIYGFSNIPSGRRILDLMVATHCTYSSPTDDNAWQGQKELRNILPLDFLHQIAMRYQKICADRSWDEDLSACDYHEHVCNDERRRCEEKAEKA